MCWKYFFWNVDVMSIVIECVDVVMFVFVVFLVVYYVELEFMVFVESCYVLDIECLFVLGVCLFVGFVEGVFVVIGVFVVVEDGYEELKLMWIDFVLCGWGLG